MTQLVEVTQNQNTQTDNQLSGEVGLLWGSIRGALLNSTFSYHKLRWRLNKKYPR